MDNYIDQSEQAQQIISHYKSTFSITQKYSTFVLGCIIGFVALIFGIINNQNAQSSSSPTKRLSYIQSGNYIQAASLYIFDSPSPLANFQAHIIGGVYTEENGKYISKHNLLAYKNIALPQYFTSPIASDYLEGNIEQQTQSYIQNFILVDTGLLVNPALHSIIQSGTQQILKDAFHLSCLGSSLLINTDFCDYNLEQFIQNADEYTIINDMEGFQNIVSFIDTPEDKNKLCTTILQYEMKSGNFDSRFIPILSSCNPEYIKKHNTLMEWGKLEHELSSLLTDHIYADVLWNQFKLASSMQLIQSQIGQGKIDIAFLSSYYSYIVKLLQSDTIDQFSLHLIYKYHNQYLLPGLTELLKTVNVDTSRDIQNSIDQLDALHYGNSLHSIGLRYRVNPEIIIPSDYSSTHAPLEENTQFQISGTTLSGIDNGVINTLIGAVDLSINKSLQNSGTTELLSGINNNLNTSTNDTHTNTNIALPSENIATTTTNNTTIAYKPSSSSNEKVIYSPNNTTTYAPNSDNKNKTIVRDRLLNHLGITPDIIITKGNKYFIEWTYKGFIFSALLDKDNDWKLSPIYVKIDDVRTIIPDFVLYLMDYDRYSQVKFLKNPETYIRQASQ